jgi:hypothetical protein
MLASKARSLLQLPKQSTSATWPNRQAVLALCERRMPAKPETRKTGLRHRRPGVQKLGNGGDKLRWRKWLGQNDAVRYALSGPFIGVGTGNIDDRQIRVGRSGAPGNIHPLIRSLPSLISTTRRRHLLPPNSVNASSPDDATAGSKPPSLRASSMML